MMRKMQKQLVVLLLIFFYSFLLFPVAILKAENASRFSLEKSFTPLGQQPAGMLRLAEAQIPSESALEDEVFINRERPFSLKTRPAPKRPWYKKWWVWTLVAAIAGGVVAANSDSGTSGAATGGGAPTPTTGSVSITGGAPLIP